MELEVEQYVDPSNEICLIHNFACFFSSSENIQRNVVALAEYRYARSCITDCQMLELAEAAIKLFFDLLMLSQVMWTIAFSASNV